MKERPEVRIIARELGVQVELSTYEVYRMREHRTGLIIPRREMDTTIRQLKQTLESAGNRVTFKQLG